MLVINKHLHLAQASESPFLFIAEWSTSTHDFSITQQHYKTVDGTAYTTPLRLKLSM